MDGYFATRKSIHARVEIFPCIRECVHIYTPKADTGINGMIRCIHAAGGIQAGIDTVAS